MSIDKVTNIRYNITINKQHSNKTTELTILINLYHVPVSERRRQQSIVRQVVQRLGCYQLRNQNLRRINIMCNTMNELEKAVADYRSLKAMKEELEAQLKDVEKNIISYLDSHKKLSATGKDFTVKVSNCERRTLDRKALEADLGSLADYDRISQYRRLYVK